MLEHPFTTPPPQGETQQIAPGVHWLRMPLPYALDHVNLWLIEEGATWTAVDTGLALDTSKAAWTSVLERFPVSRQIVTHFHPDHLGLAAWLEERTGAPLWITRGEYQCAKATLAQSPGYSVADTCALFRAHGLDDDRLGTITRRGNAYAHGAPRLPDTFRPLIEGEEISIGDQRWKVIVGRGHSPEHASLYCARLGILISGDMMLPNISTHIGVHPTDANGHPLADFLAALSQMERLPEDTLVLPSHGRPFRGLHTRIEHLRAHHRARCNDLLNACALQPKTAAELLPILFAREIQDPHQLFFAMGEAIAHLIHLEQSGTLTRQMSARGVFRFRTAGQAKADRTNGPQT